MSWIGRHWRGELSIFRAFWVNLVLLRLLAMFLQDYIQPLLPETTTLTFVVTIAWVFGGHLVLLVWQVVGALRTVDRWIAGSGQRNNVFQLHLGVVFCVLMALLSGLGALQSLWFGPDDRFAKYKPFTWLDDYEVRIVDGGKRLIVRGDFKTGISGDVAKMLQDNLRTSVILLESRGGRVAEGRAMAELIRSKKLATHVTAVCNSACATAFIGGYRRSLGPEGRLGFHRFRLDAPYYNPEVSAKEQQAADLGFYQSQGLLADFLDKVFKAEAAEIWYPDPRQLLAAGVIHKMPED